MPEDNPLAERGRSLEEDYFRKKDRELVERMRRAAAAQKAREDLSQASGLSDPELVTELEELGFTTETVRLLPLVPLLQVAWAEGSVSDGERRLIVHLARARGVVEGSPADRELANWLTTRPSEALFARATRLVRAMLSTSSGEGNLSPDDLVEYCESIASASGGLLGINRVSAEERSILKSIAAALKQR